jgi:DNA-binding FrmR family transcriptional regulator
MQKIIKSKNSNIKSLVHIAHDHSGELRRLSRIKGQVEGVERMINEHRYCPDIVHQIKAVRSALKSVEISIIEGHLKHCVKAAVASRNNEVIQEKMEEILLLLKAQG